VLREGNIEIFGPTSVITFTDSNESFATLTLPNTSISAKQVETNVNEKKINVVDLRAVAVKYSIPIAWNTTYDGNSTVTELVSYSYNNGAWTQFNQKTGIPFGNSMQTALLDISSFPPGYFDIQVEAFSNSGDAATVYKIIGPIYTFSKGIFIKLE
jgi:hypothetical protein